MICVSEKVYSTQKTHATGIQSKNIYTIIIYNIQYIKPQGLDIQLVQFINIHNNIYNI
jgi:hypothetical protein